jgi:hypothetical protein
MWLEYIRYRFRLDARQDCLELAQRVALTSLRHSARCRGWRVLQVAGDPSRMILKIEWDPGVPLTLFHGSEESAELHAALGEQASELADADYCANPCLLESILGGHSALLSLAEDILAGVMREPWLRSRFQSADDSRRSRLGLWLLEVLGGSEMFSWSFPGATARDGPIAGELLDLEERERLLEIAEQVLPDSVGEQGRCVLGALRANLPLHPPPPSLAIAGSRLQPSAMGSGPSVALTRSVASARSVALTRSGVLQKSVALQRSAAGSSDAPASGVRGVRSEDGNGTGSGAGLPGGRRARGE